MKSFLVGLACYGLSCCPSIVKDKVNDDVALLVEGNTLSDKVKSLVLDDLKKYEVFEIKDSRMVKCALNELKNKVSGDFVFYFMGHGGKTGNLYTCEGKSLTLFDFKKKTNGLAGLFVIDSCYSGKVLDAIKNDVNCVFSSTGDSVGFHNEEWSSGERFLRYLNVLPVKEAFVRTKKDVVQYWGASVCGDLFVGNFCVPDLEQVIPRLHVGKDYDKRGGRGE